MEAYLQQVRQMIQAFPNFCIGQIPCDQNMVVNLLANLAIHHDVVERKIVSLKIKTNPMSKSHWLR